jgi:hypothetical protein
MQSISDEHGIGGGHAYHMRNTLLRRAGAALKTRKWKNAALNHAAKYIRKATAVTGKNVQPNTRRPTLDLRCHEKRQARESEGENHGGKRDSDRSVRCLCFQSGPRRLQHANNG